MSDWFYKNINGTRGERVGPKRAPKIQRTGNVTIRPWSLERLIAVLTHTSLLRTFDKGQATRATLNAMECIEHEWALCLITSELTRLAKHSN